MLELSRALGLFSVHCNAKVNCVFELSKKRRQKNTKKRRKKEKRKEYQKKEEKRKVRGK